MTNKNFYICREKKNGKTSYSVHTFRTPGQLFASIIFTMENIIPTVENFQFYMIVANGSEVSMTDKSNGYDFVSDATGEVLSYFECNA